ncbi:histidine phosphatase family protein [Bacillus sp. 2205SS5-2]|uniref:histidine phosphatase family protein n=1 Tax=Bacillus sp. 2205SS5-2 TaxID=3109031 RepID=UPI003005940B
MGTCRRVDLYLVRHGLTDWNREKRYLGHTDRDVIVEELEQLSSLKKEIGRLRFHYVYSSDLVRCLSTLDFLDLSVTYCEDARLRELNFGEWEGKTFEELKDFSLYHEWINNWEQTSPPKGESGIAFQQRVNSCVEEMLETIDSANILIVTHGGVIRYLLSKFKASNFFWESPVVKHGQCLAVRLVEREGGWTCSSLLVVPTLEKGE